MRFTGKTLIITGAASGIGTATARVFAREGANVVLSYINSCAAIAAEITDLGGVAVRAEGDITSHDIAKAVVDEAVRVFSSVDILIHNAGIGYGGTVETFEEDAFNRLWNTNFKAAVLLARHTIPVMRSQKEGFVPLTGAVNGIQGAANSFAYSSSKAAIINLAKSLALDHGRDGIRVNSVSPGPVETPMFEQANKAFKVSSDFFENVSPTGRVATAEDVADAFAFLASDAARSITGHNLVVDNGMSAGMFVPKPL